MTKQSHTFCSCSALCHSSPTHTHTHSHRKQLKVGPVSSYQLFAHVEKEGAVCIPGPLACRLPVSHSMSRLTEAAPNAETGG